MLEVLSRRWPAVEVWVCPVRVQGDGASLEMAEAIAGLNLLRPADDQVIDVLILGRGGGSLEDLWPFNEECLAEAIVASRIPIITGIGHEDDLTIADMVADCRALTPSEAAERIVPDRTKVLEWLSDLDTRFLGLLSRRVDLLRSRLDDLANRRAFRMPLDRVRNEEERLDDMQDRLSRSIQKSLEQSQQRLDATGARLENLSPLNVLSRGYSLTHLEGSREMIRSAQQVQVGQRIVTRVRHGQIASRIEETSTDGLVDNPAKDQGHDPR
jgi:exodeoxyribonuclease VII large subunit